MYIALHTCTKSQLQVSSSNTNCRVKTFRQKTPNQKAPQNFETFTNNFNTQGQYSSSKNNPRIEKPYLFVNLKNTKNLLFTDAGLHTLQ